MDTEHTADAEACRRLLSAVIELAAKDLRFLYQAGTDVRSSRKRHRQVAYYCPVKFFSGDWYREMCSYLGVDPDRFRRLAYQKARAA